MGKKTEPEAIEPLKAPPPNVAVLTIALASGGGHQVLAGGLNDAESIQAMLSAIDAVSGQLREVLVEKLVERKAAAPK